VVAPPADGEAIAAEATEVVEISADIGDLEVVPIDADGNPVEAAEVEGVEEGAAQPVEADATIVETGEIQAEEAATDATIPLAEGASEEVITDDVVDEVATPVEE
jgi:hypothetical protein